MLHLIVMRYAQCFNSYIPTLKLVVPNGSMTPLTESLLQPNHPVKETASYVVHHSVI